MSYVVNTLQHRRCPAMSYITWYILSNSLREVLMSIKLGSTAFPEMPRQTESLMVLDLHAKVATLSFLFMT